jgi:hypothetical protein
MKYTTDMVSGAMTYIPNFIDWFRHSKVVVGGGIHRDTGRMEIA